MIPSDVEKLKAAFEDREFTGKQLAEVMGLADFRASGAAIKSLRRQRLVYQTVN